MSKELLVRGTLSKKFEIIEGTRFYDNGSCVQIQCPKSKEWYLVSKKDFTYIKRNFDLSYTKDDSVLFSKTHYNIIVNK